MCSRACSSLISFVLGFAIHAAGAESVALVETEPRTKDLPVFLKPPVSPLPPPSMALPPAAPAPRPGESSPPSPKLSSATSQAIRAGLPAFRPPKPVDPIPDDVVVLSKVEVLENKIRLPSPTDVLTKAGREEFLRKKYPHATTFMLGEIQRLEDMKELNDVADTLNLVGRKADSQELRREIRDTFMRRTNPRDEAIDKIYNRGHR